MRELKYQFTMNKDDFLLGPVISVGIALLGAGIIGWLNIARGKQEIATISAVLAAVIGVLYGLLLGYGGVAIQFNLALKMGAIRRRFLPSILLLGFGVVFVILQLGNLCAYAESALLHWAGAPSVRTVYVSLPLALGLAAGVALVGTWVGSIAMRSRNMGNGFLVGAMIVPSWGFALFASGLDEDRTDWLGRSVKAVAGFFTSLPPWGVGLAMGVCACAVLGHTWFLLRRAAAKD